jgi:hypothetical protein
MILPFMQIRHTVIEVVAAGHMLASSALMVAAKT